MTIIAKMASTEHGDVSLACFNAQCRGIKFYNLAEVGVEVGGRLLFRIQTLQLWREVLHARVQTIYSARRRPAPCHVAMPDVRDFR